MAVTLNNLGTLDSAQNRLDEAQAHYEEALKDYRALADKNPDLPALPSPGSRQPGHSRQAPESSRSGTRIRRNHLRFFSALTAKDPERFL